MDPLDDLIRQAGQVARQRRDQMANEAKVRRQMDAYQRLLTEDRTLQLDFRSAEQVEMDNCTLRDIEVRGLTESQCAAQHRCYLCGRNLNDKRRRWCTDAHWQVWYGNHEWTQASHAVLKRDDWTCVRCGAQGSHYDYKTQRWVGGGREERCEGCREIWPCTTTRQWVPVTMYGGTSYSYVVDHPNGHYATVRSTVLLEVNHRDPLVGRGYHKGCVHHQDKLETLCREDHVIETTRQRRERADTRVAARVKALGFDMPEMGL